MNQPPIPVPEHVPEPGFYYHYKHDPNGPENDMAYEVLGTGWHTETGEFSVLYRPLYATSGAYISGKLTYLRPLGMFVDTVQKPEYTGPRFVRITDPSIIERMKALRAELYGQD